MEVRRPLLLVHVLQMVMHQVEHVRVLGSRHEIEQVFCQVVQLIPP